MGPLARREYVRDLQKRYDNAHGRKEKGRILDEVCANLGCHRKHAIRLLNGAAPSLERPFRQRDCVYPERLIRVLESIWRASFYLWSDRLKMAMPLWLPWAKKSWKLSAEEEAQLLGMSASTMDRRLASYKQKLGRRIYGKTKPGKFLRERIPIQAESWRIPEPGWSEVDTVSHSGACARGIFAYTVNEVDLFSGWVESRAVLGKGSCGVVQALHDIRQVLPFAQKGIDSDNGEEFINWHLVRYCEEQKLAFSRSRPYKKDDQAHIEQKNWTNVRKLLGWDRYDTEAAVAAMNDLYRNELRLLSNLFLPSVKLNNKIRIGSKLKRVYDYAKTPLDRLLESGQGNRQRLDELRTLRERIDPFRLSQMVDKKLQDIWALATRTPIAIDKSEGSGRKWAQRVASFVGPEATFDPFRGRAEDSYSMQWARERAWLGN
jgi:transposase InsO family protein